MSQAKWIAIGIIAAVLGCDRPNKTTTVTGLHGESVTLHYTYEDAYERQMYDRMPLTTQPDKGDYCLIGRRLLHAQGDVDMLIAFLPKDDATTTKLRAQLVQVQSGLAAAEEQWYQESRKFR